MVLCPGGRIGHAFYERVSLYVVRNDKNGDKLRDSAPCSSCSLIMKSLNIKYVIWSNSDGSLSKCRVRDYYTTHKSQGSKFIERGLIDNII